MNNLKTTDKGNQSALWVRGIRWGDGDALFQMFSRTRAVRRQIVDAGQETAEPDFGRHPNADD